MSSNGKKWIFYRRGKQRTLNTYIVRATTVPNGLGWFKFWLHSILPNWTKQENMQFFVIQTSRNFEMYMLSLPRERMASVFCAKFHCLTFLNFLICWILNFPYVHLKWIKRSDLQYSIFLKASKLSLKLHHMYQLKIICWMRLNQCNLNC